MAEHVFNWIEIAVTDFNRARIFYESMLGVTMNEMEFGGYRMGFFPGYNENVVSGAIVYGKGYAPSDNGTVVYFNANPDLTEMLNRAEKAGAKVLQSKKQISEDYGYMALLLDSEGNRIALHSNK